ncbi:MAG: N-formylglutamate amidohydrolase [Pseudomonadota bacterium]
MSESAFEIYAPSAPNRWVITCDHAQNTVPDFVAGGDLGIGAQDMARHIAYDIGAAGVSRALALRLGGTAVLSSFSRLVIDPNRGEDDPTLIMRLYDGTIIPANKTMTPDERRARLDRLYLPYHAAQSRVLGGVTAPVIVSIHSFTPQLRGRAPRPWQIGILSAQDRRLADPLVTRLRAETGLCVGDNEPYNGALAGDSMDRHALQHGRPHVLIELRNDLISSQRQQIAWADRLAPILEETLLASGL